MPRVIGRKQEKLSWFLGKELIDACAREFPRRCRTRWGFPLSRGCRQWCGQSIVSHLVTSSFRIIMIVWNVRIRSAYSLARIFTHINRSSNSRSFSILIDIPIGIVVNNPIVGTAWCRRRWMCFNDRVLKVCDGNVHSCHVDASFLLLEQELP